jgi:hypothetical protein
MNYYSKYLKYKSKYLQLKINQSGGHLIEEKYYSYYLVGHFNRYQEDLLSNIKNKLLREFSVYLTPYQDKVKPHLTLIYGPAKIYKDSDEIELKTSQNKLEQETIINDIYPTILKKYDEIFKGVNPILKFKCISVFIRSTRIILKAEFECEELEEFIRYSRINLDFFKKSMDDIKKEYMENKDSLKEKYSELFYDDTTLDEVKPHGFIHCTFCSIDSSKVDKDILKEIILKANKIAELMNLKINDEYKIDTIDVRIPYSKEYIKIR